MDPLYGQKALAEFSEYVVASLFEVAPSSSSKRSPANIIREGIDTPPYTPPLDGHASSSKREPPALIEFIAYALYRTRLPLSIVHQSLLLLSRLKQRYPSARGTSSSPHRLFLSALMLSAKISMDDTYSNKSWAIVGSNYFALKEVNQMERELFAFLGWNVVVQKEELDSFIAAAQVAFEASQSSSSRLPVLRAVNAHTSPVHMSSPLATPPMSCPTSPQPSASTSSSSRRVSPTPSTSSSRSSSTESTSKRQRRSSPSQQQQQSEEAAAASRHQQAKNAARALLRPHTYRHTSPVSSRGSSRASSAASSAIGSPAACFSSYSVVHSPATSSHRMHPYALRSSVSMLQQQSQQSSQTSSTSSSAFPSVTHSPTSPASAPLSAGPQTPISEVEGLHVHASAVQQQQKVQPPMHSAGLSGVGELDFPEAAGYFAARSSVDAAPVTAMQH